MKFHLPLITTALVTYAACAETPKIFAGLLKEGATMRGEVGIVLPPREIDRYVAKVEKAAKADPAWFKEFASKAKPGVPLPFDPKLGLTKEEYDEYLKLWGRREFKPMEEVLLLLRKSAGDTWSITGTRSAACISTLRYNPATDTFNSPNGELKRLKDIKADADSLLGAWSGMEWKFEGESIFGKTKENLALGKMEKSGHGLLVYRFQEVTTEGRMVVDRSVVVRFTPGKAGEFVPPKKEDSGIGTLKPIAP
jgi:hypothetical protein